MISPKRYPQKPIQRSLLRALGRLLLPPFARLNISGKENFPEEGPLILVGNHTGALEVVLMTVYSPQIVEYLGSMDIPHESYIAAFIKLYGIIPILRGRTSRSSMMAALEVLKQGKYLGVFPEGGIWEPSIHAARTGVAWLSYHSQSPILPIGFASTQGALNKLLRLDRPSLEMNIGPVIPPVTIPKGKPHKIHFQDAAREIMDSVWNLVPEAVQNAESVIRDEQFEFNVSAIDDRGMNLSLPPTRMIHHGQALSKFIHRPILFNTLRDNLDLPIHALQLLHTSPSNAEIRLATNAILTYLKTDNPYYFTYRYGQQEGSAMQSGIQELHELAAWANTANLRLVLKPIRRYRKESSFEEIVLDRPEELRKW